MRLSHQAIRCPFTNHRRGTQRRAAAAVECAIVSIFILAPLLGGMLELGRAMLAKETLCNAARKGCRTGIMKQYGSSDIYHDALNIMQDNGYGTNLFNPAPPSGGSGSGYIGAINITVTDPTGVALSNALDAPPGSTVTVQVSIPVSSVLWVSSFFLSASTLESDVVVMMKQ
jgi:Flp pilus assembly protein TadG